MNLNRDFPISRSVYFDETHPAGPSAFDLFSDSYSLIAGLSAEFAPGTNFSIEADALHRSLHLNARNISPDGATRPLFHQSIATWEFPVLLKYQVRVARGFRPFFEAGPSFRTRDNPAPSEPSQFGATAGAGVSFNVGRIRISPELRYTRWQYDGDYPRIATKRDQIELLTGFSFGTSPTSWKIHCSKSAWGSSPARRSQAGSNNRPLLPELVL